MNPYQTRRAAQVGCGIAGTAAAVAAAGVAPAVLPQMGTATAPVLPFWPAALVLALSAAVLVVGRRTLIHRVGTFGANLGRAGAVAVGLVVLTGILPALLSPVGGLAGAALVAAALFWAWWRVPARLLPAPARGQVWWAQVRFEESTQSKDRPCLVVGAGRREAKVLMFTSRHRPGDTRYRPVPAHLRLGDGRDTYLRTDRVITVRLEAFRRYDRDWPLPVVDELGY